MIHFNHHLFRIACSAVILILLSCSKSDETAALNPQQEVASNLIIPVGFPEMNFPENNQYSTERWELGKKLFYEKRLSIDNSISCGSCHAPSLSFSDSVAFSRGANNTIGTRNAPSLANVGYQPYFMREGAVPTLEMQVLVPIQEQNEFAHNILKISELLMTDSIYSSMSRAAYQRELDPFVITRALSVFERTIISGSSAYDRYQYQRDLAALNQNEKRGMELFFSERTNCSTCHSGFNFTNYSFENNGLDSIYTDPGRSRLTGLASDVAKFKVPSLRNVSLTAPYMHNGRFNSLIEVVEHYNSGGENHMNKSNLITPLQLSVQEKSDLVAFLQSLTDENFVKDERWNP